MRTQSVVAALNDAVAAPHVEHHVPMPTRPEPEPWRILSASDALPRLRTARHHLDEALRALGALPEVTREVSSNEFISACSWHDYMQDVLELVAETGERVMPRNELAQTSERMSLMRAVLAFAEPFDEASARLRQACIDLEDEVYGALWEAGDRLRELSNDDPALAAKLRERGVLPEIDDEQPTTNGGSR
jgi:hypothetical protein